MDAKQFSQLNRREVLAGGGALVVGFTLAGPSLTREAAPPAPVKLPGSLDQNRLLDAWIRIDAEGEITVFTGKAELGQGIRTALTQVAAEELDVAPGDIRLTTADTATTPNEGLTAGSQSMQNGATAVRIVAAHVRTLMAEEAARQLGVPAESLRAEDKSLMAPDGRAIGYGPLAAAIDLHVEAPARAALKPTAEFKVMGRPVRRVDIPAKVTGAAAYVQDMRPDGMLHARVVRPSSFAAELVSVETARVEAMPGVVKVVRDGRFLAVVAERETQAIDAMRALEADARWSERPTLPDQTRLPEALKALEREVGIVAESGSPEIAAAAKTVRATYTRPYQIHGSIGPSCALALMEGDRLTVWSHTQGVFPNRAAIAEMMKMPPEAVRVVHAEGAGCYGHNGADDAAADAALIARAVPGRPVRLHWTREQEHAWEPYGPAMVMEVEAALGADGRIATWNYDVWSNPHNTRPGGAAALLPARHLAEPFLPEPARVKITEAGNGDRNAIPLYSIPNRRIRWRFLPDMPVRTSALRGLGAYANVFALESTMDELAREAGADPVAFRLRHLDDPRARTVVERAAERFGWGNGAVAGGRGHGFAFARYKNIAAYLAVALEIEVQRETGRPRVTRAVAAIDSGEIVSPDGIRNQTEGGILQSISWTLYEQATFDDTRITSVDWSSYPILRFASVPDSVEVELVERPGEPFLGTGEAAQGPVAAAIANALHGAVGKRLRDLPFTREKLKAAIGV